MRPSADCARKCPPKAIKAPFKPFFGNGARVQQGFALFGLFEAIKNPHNGGSEGLAFPAKYS